MKGGHFGQSCQGSFSKEGIVGKRRDKVRDWAMGKPRGKALWLKGSKRKGPQVGA